MKSGKYFITRVPVFVLVLCIALISIVALGTMVKTAIQLASISFDIQLIEADAATGAHNWGENVVKCYNNDIAERNALCNSNNKLVSRFSVYNGLIRLIMLASAIMVAIPSISICKQFLFAFRCRISRMLIK